MYNCNTDSLGLILGVEVFFSEGHCSGALWVRSPVGEMTRYLASTIHCQIRNSRGRHRRGLIWDSTFGSGDKRIENFPLLHFKRICDEKPEHPRIFFNLTNQLFWQDKIEVKCEIPSPALHCTCAVVRWLVTVNLMTYLPLMQHGTCRSYHVCMIML